MSIQTFILIGRSGCGKGTQGKLLNDYLAQKDPQHPVLYIQSGSELREFIKGDSHTQKLAKDSYMSGKLQPEFLMITMWSRLFVDRFTGNEHLIIDGTPRKFDEAGVLDSAFGFYGLDKPIVVHIDASREKVIERLLSRGRMDDSRDDIELRLGWYETDVVPTIKYYENNPKYHFVRVDGDKTIEEVHKDIIAFFESKAPVA